MIKLNTPATDRATGLKGHVTHLLMEINHNIRYLFKPGGLTPEGQPKRGYWVTREQLDDVTEGEAVKLPISVLGTEVKHTMSGFKGMALRLMLHPTGCVHVEVQPKGVVKATGAPLEDVNFSILELEGPALKKLSQAAKTAEQMKRPSPSPAPRQSFRVP